MRKLILFAALGLLMVSCCQCKQERVSIETQMIHVDNSTDSIADQAYMDYLAPTKAFMDSEMGIILGYAPDSMKVDTFECTMLNWAADALLDAAQKLYPKHVDFALINRGGARCSWVPGNITLGDVFDMMPFDNRMVVVTLNGEQVLELFTKLAKGNAQGIAGMRVKFVKKQLAEITIGGKPVDPKAIYRIATNSYLAKGKDGMTALKYDKHPWDSGLRIRDIYVEAVRKQGTLRPTIDGRMVIEK